MEEKTKPTNDNAQVTNATPRYTYFNFDGTVEKSDEAPDLGEE